MASLFCQQLLFSSSQPVKGCIGLTSGKCPASACFYNGHFEPLHSLEKQTKMIFSEENMSGACQCETHNIFYAWSKWLLGSC